LTVREVLRRPRSFFRELDGGALGSSVAFAVAVFLPAIAIQSIAAYLAMTRLPIAVFPSRRLAESPELLFALLPITAILFLAYLTTFYQAISAIASKSRPELSATIRGTCFGLAPMVVAIVPLVGLFVGLVWMLVLHAIALREIHGVSRL